MPVVHRRIEEVLQRRKLAIVAHEADGIERRRLQDDLDLVIVTVQPGARMLWRQSADGMGGGERKAFCDSVHGPCFDRVGCDRAGLSRQFIRSRFVGADYGAEGSSASSGITAAGRTRRPSAE